MHVAIVVRLSHPTAMVMVMVMVMIGMSNA
jgi:hypothetical protein